MLDDLPRQHVIDSSDEKTILVHSNVDISANTPCAGKSQANWQIAILSRTMLPQDTFFARLETESGHVILTPPIVPFSTGNTIKTNILATDRTLDATCFTKGFLGESSLKQETVWKAAIPEECFRSALFDFESYGWDSLGERPIPGGQWTHPDWYKRLQMIIDGGIAGKKCLQLKKGEELPLAARLVPLTSCTIEFDIYPLAFPKENARLLGRISWNWGSACDLKIDPRGYVSASRGCGRPGDPGAVPQKSFRSSYPLALNQWQRITLTFDEKELILYLNGKKEGSIMVPPMRDFGHDTPVLGDSTSGLSARFDNLLLHSYPQSTQKIKERYEKEYQTARKSKK